MCFFFLFPFPLLSPQPTRYKITDIIGKEEGLGTENLRGSGMIAGESSLAYEGIITINLVICSYVCLRVVVGARNIQYINPLERLPGN